MTTQDPIDTVAWFAALLAAAAIGATVAYVYMRLRDWYRSH